MRQDGSCRSSTCPFVSGAAVALAAGKIETQRGSTVQGGIDMAAAARLRIFPRPEGESYDEPETPDVPIRLVELYPLLAQAYRDNYAWLRDFEDDQVLVSSDLFEVVRAFANYRPSA
jgi:hypothetical protein